MAQNITIVAIHNLPLDKESKAKPLAAATGKTPYEATARLRGPGTGPIVLATFRDAGQAAEFEDKLKQAGFDPIVIGGGELEHEGNIFTVRNFVLAENILKVENPKGETLDLPWADVEVILRGMSRSTQTSKETTKEKKFDAGMAIMTGGLKFSKTHTSTSEVRTDASEGFIRLYSSNRPVILFLENGVNYESLGPMRQPTRIASFARMDAELKARSLSASYDNRLMNRMEQLQLLGPMLDPQGNMHIATALLSKALRPPRPA